MEPLLTTEEVAEWLRVDVVTVRRLISRGELPAYRIGNEYRFKTSELEAYLQRQRVSGEEGVIPQQRFGDADWLATDRGSLLSAQVRTALALAQEEATRFRHPFISPEHILLGLA